MKRKKIGTRLSIMVAISVFITAAVTSVTSLLLMDDVIDTMGEKRAEDNVHIIEEEINAYLDLAESSVRTLSAKKEFTAAVGSGNVSEMATVIDDFYTATAMKSNNITVIGSDGTVLYRYYIDKKGDSMADKPYFQESLAGKIVTTLTSTEDIPMGSRATSPINDAQGNVIGVLSVTFPISTEGFVDELKGNGNTDFTIFKDKTRVMTTIKNGGERAVGTDMDEKVAKTVLENKEEYNAETEIFGNPYVVCYKPLISDSGTVLGAMFAGVNISDIKSEIYLAMGICAGVAVAAIALSVVILIMFVNRAIVKPVNVLVKAADEMAGGNLNVDAKVNSNTEIGALSASIEQTISNMRAYIGDMSEHMDAMANGDLTQEVTMDYVGDFAGIKNSINKISGALNATLSSINTAAEQVNAGAEQVATAAQSLSQGATEQASSIEELSGSIMQVSEQVNENAKNVNVAGGYVKEAENGIINSNEYMKQMMDAMNDINDSSQQISRIIKVIDDIAFQTNILALNAAVEAARAGAAGKGFSVVADEVRNLASKSADAAGQTTKLIEGSVDSVSRGMNIAKETAKALETAQSQSTMVTETIEKIQKASNEQADAINQITIGVEQISSVVQTNSATSEESAAASQELSGQAQMLQQEISQFRLNGSGGSTEGFGSSASSGSSDFSISLDDDKY